MKAVKNRQLIVIIAKAIKQIIVCNNRDSFFVIRGVTVLCKNLTVPFTHKNDVKMPILLSILADIAGWMHSIRAFSKSDSTFLILIKPQQQGNHSLLLTE